MMLAQLASFASASCVGYSDSFDVQVLDANLGAVEGASVVAKFDRGATFGEQYFITQPKLTNANGMVHFDIFNQGTLSRTIDCTITINTSVSGLEKTVSVEADQHGSRVDVKLEDVFPLRFFVRDQLRAPIEGASVFVGNKTNKTDSEGMYKSYFKKGSYNYLASYQDSAQSGKLNITNNTVFEIIFTYRKISIEVTNDAGKPLDATLTIFNQSFQIQNGTFEKEKAYGEEIPYRIEYLGLVHEDKIVPALEPMAVVRFDINSPSFGDIVPQPVNGGYRLKITVKDPNTYASGVDVSSIKVRYKIEPSDATTPWSNAIVFTTARDQFTADFPKLPANSIVKADLEVKDKAGNRAEKEVTFSISTPPPSDNETQNDTNTHPEPPQGQEIPLLYIAGSVILLVLAIYLLIRIKSKATGGG